MSEIQFELAPGGVGLTKQWANQWEALISKEWSDARDSYRLRMERFWSDQFEQTPHVFSMAGPCEILIVATLLRYWVLVRPAESDALRFLAHWEDQELDRWESFRDPADVVLSRVIDRFGEGDESWIEVESGQLHGQIVNTHAPTRYHPIDPGYALADHDAGTAQLYDQLAELASDARVDRQALRVARDHLREVSAIGSAQKRGKAFEPVLAEALRAHGCTVELGKTFDGEQIDLFISKPQIAVTEVRWKKKPLQTEAISVLIRKVQRRPPIFLGLYVSMSGFTKGARNAALDARDRAILLMERGDVDLLFAGERHFSEIWQAQIDKILRRY
jgi:hypothetical protein